MQRDLVFLTLIQLASAVESFPLPLIRKGPANKFACFTGVRLASAIRSIPLALYKEGPHK